MKANCELVYADGKMKAVSVELKDGLKGTRLLNAIDKAVKKQFPESSPGGNWERWNLHTIEEDFL